MKRDARGNPITTVHRWNRPPLSCNTCREKKRRCDRAQPCSNCVLRNVPCEYSGGTDGPNSLEHSQIPTSSTAGNQSSASYAGTHIDSAPHNFDEMLFRIRRLEEALLEQSNVPPRSNVSQLPGTSVGLGVLGGGNSISQSQEQPFTAHYVTPFSMHYASPSLAGGTSTSFPLANAPSLVELARQLPPLWQARELFDHFAAVLQPTYGVLHIPSSREIMENIYSGILDGKPPPAADLMLVFAIFAGAALGWTPTLLNKINATREEARAALIAYSQLAMAILEHPAPLIQPSTTALVATGTLGHLLINTDGFPVRVQILRHHCLLMSRDLKIHKLDTAKAREERRLKGCDMIEVEVQRRAWWSMVASDWLLSFCGGIQEGAYIFQPRHMNVNMPTNTDDEFITSTGIQQVFPMSEPTSLSAFYGRVQCADLCRKVIDALPSVLLGSQEPEYETILDLDRQFHEHLAGLPTFFQLDPESIEQSRQICKERPYIAWQRLSIHFSLHTRLCRLHRPYHLEGISDPKYAYSHMVCIRSAHKVLEIRRLMEEVEPEIGLKAARFWTVMHHVFFAALILAMDVSFNPAAPDVAARKAKVLAAYEVLEQSKRESSYLMEGIQKNLQTLMATLHKNRSQSSVLPKDAAAAREGPSLTDLQDGNIAMTAGEGAEAHDEQAPIALPSSTMPADGNILINDLGEDSWDKLWSEFVAVAPDLDVPQWNSLLEDVEFPPHFETF